MSRRSFSRSTLQARSTATASWSSVSARSRCSSVAYSCRRSLAWARARCSDFSRLRDNTLVYPSLRIARGLILFQGALQRMLVLPSEIHHLGHLRLGHLVSIDAADPDPPIMHVEHDAGSFLPVLVEKAFEDVDDELHRGVVVV